MKVEKISPKSLSQRIKKKEEVVILDVRGLESYQKNHITADHVKGLHLPKAEIFALEDEEKTEHPSLSKEEEMIVTCTSGNSATRCAHILAERGYQVKVLDGGMTAWNQYKVDES